MSDFKLPTTAGSVVSFEGWADADETEKFRYLVSLVPGHYENGEFVGAVWTDSYGEDGGVYDVAIDQILEGDPEVIYEAPEPQEIPAGTLDMFEERLYGAIVLVEDMFGEKAVAMFVPGCIADGEITDASWVNSYGGYFTQEEIEKSALALLVKGSTEL